MKKIMLFAYLYLFSLPILGSPNSYPEFYRKFFNCLNNGTCKIKLYNAEISGAKPNCPNGGILITYIGSQLSGDTPLKIKTDEKDADICYHFFEIIFWDRYRSYKKDPNLTHCEPHPYELSDFEDALLPKNLPLPIDDIAPFEAYSVLYAVGKDPITKKLKHIMIDVPHFLENPEFSNQREQKKEIEEILEFLDLHFDEITQRATN